ncbi:MAG: carboxylating nicotinate-nucleotide diphosphorylase [Phycisphaerales bacterium]|jgi:nicotinate-nucleotide pyrophosphorylase (carboxylating)|nr:carboxylating nicotinate-nucleotide diphosphorylase [Phycisphaerales bacterium]
MNETIEQPIIVYMRDILRRCIEEDVGLEGDVTTKSIIPVGQQGCYVINVRGIGTISGLNPIAEVIEEFGDFTLEMFYQDGDEVKSNNIALLQGQVRDILIVERSILNVLGYASGIATRTKKFVDAVSGTDCTVCDTRKTTPGLRLLDKYAVTCGGGTSHRMGLHDAALYKDNHLAGMEDVVSELGAAISRVKENNSLQFVEVEVDTLAQLKKVLLLPVDIILLDNMSLEMLREAVSLRDAAQTSPLLEASGGVTLETVRSIAETGVDRISIGGLVHQATWIDIGLDSIDG